MEVLQTCRLEGNEGDGGAGVRFEDLKEMEEMELFFSFVDSREMRGMEEPGAVFFEDLT